MQLGTLPVARLLKLAWSPMMRQYQVGESFARAVHDRYGMAVLNRAWESPETLPRRGAARLREVVPSGGRRRRRGRGQIVEGR